MKSVRCSKKEIHCKLPIEINGGLTDVNNFNVYLLFFIYLTSYLL